MQNMSIAGLPPPPVCPERRPMRPSPPERSLMLWLRGQRKFQLGLQAIVAARFSNAAPELTAALLSLANAFLPGPPNPDNPEFWQADQSMAG
jgi:hypothetical protein